MKNKYLILIVLLVNIFGITIPYLYKNHQLSDKIKNSQNTISEVYDGDNKTLNEQEYYKLVRNLNDNTQSHGMTNISTNTIFAGYMTYNISFSSDKESLKSYINFLDKLDKDLILNEASLNFKNNEQSNITLISR